MRWVTRAHYGIVLLLIVANIVLIASSSGTGWSYVAIVACQAVTLLACLRAAGAAASTRRIAAAGALLATLAVAGSRIGAGADPGAFARLVNAALIALAPVIIGRELWTHPRVTAHTVAGALCIYLFVGMLFMTLYGVVANFGHGPVFHGGRASEPDRLYFSFTTLTTTGFGDITPATGGARALAVLEALTGQIYLVTVIAVLIGRIGQVRRVPQDPAPVPERTGAGPSGSRPVSG